MPDSANTSDPSLARRPPSRMLWGPGALDRLGAELERLGIGRALVVCGSTLGSNDDVVTRLERCAHGRLAGLLASVRSHSPVGSILEAVEEFRRSAYDGLIGLGGGSAMVSVRAIAILAAETRPLQELATRRDDHCGFVSPRLERPKSPILALPTTPTTAVPTAASALTEEGIHDRYALFDPKTRAATVIIDPILLSTSPPGLVRASSFNAIAMGVEGLLSSRAVPFSDALIGRSLRVQLENLAEVERGMECRVDMTLGSIMIGEGVELSGVGLTAALSHVIGHRFGVPNGEVDMVLLPHVLDFLSRSGLPVKQTISREVGADFLSDFSATLAAISAPRSLTDLGVRGEDHPSIAEAAMNDFASSTSPVRVTTAELSAILAAAG